MRDSGFAWPVIDLRVKYIKPIAVGDDIIVHAKVVEYEHRLKIEYRVTHADTGERLTKGSTSQVAVGLNDGEMRMESPPILLKKLGVMS